MLCGNLGSPTQYLNQTSWLGKNPDQVTIMNPKNSHISYITQAAHNYQELNLRQPRGGQATDNLTFSMVQVAKLPLQLNKTPANRSYVREFLVTDTIRFHLTTWTYLLSLWRDRNSLYTIEWIYNTCPTFYTLRETIRKK